MSAGPRVAFLLGDDFDYMLTLLMAMGEARFGIADPSLTTAAPRPLPLVPDGDAVLIGSSWAEKQIAGGVDVPGAVIPELRRRFGRIAGLDQETSFQLQFSEAMLRALDVVIKPNGLYREAGLYPPAHLHLSVPNFTIMGLEARALARRYHRSPFGRMVRNVADRALAAAQPIDLHRPPPATAQFAGTLTNIQRLDMLRLLKQRGVRLVGGITGVAAKVTGSNGVAPAQLARQAAAEGFLTPRLGRLRYRASMARAKTVLSIAGHGEICFRMAEAWSARRVLVCQDLSHARTLFPFENGRNVVFCRPDLADLADILDDVEGNLGRYASIAEQGHADWREWSGRVDELLRTGFAPILHS